VRSARFSLVVLCASLLMALGQEACSRRQSALTRLGKDLFTGGVALKARMVGHDSDLPPSVVRCKNCHLVSNPPPVASAGGSAGLTEKLGPVLRSETLTRLRARRGGPPSKYDEERFCRVLRKGIDPAYVMLPSSMPRYTVNQQECQALWAYLTSQ
jgi:hypothetical protein